MAPGCRRPRAMVPHLRVPGNLLQLRRYHSSFFHLAVKSTGDMIVSSGYVRTACLALGLGVPLASDPVHSRCTTRVVQASSWFVEGVAQSQGRHSQENAEFRQAKAICAAYSSIQFSGRCTQRPRNPALRHALAGILHVHASGPIRGFAPCTWWRRGMRALSHLPGKPHMCCCEAQKAQEQAKRGRD